MNTARNIPQERANALLSVIKEFRCLSPTDIAILASACQWHRYEAGAKIIHYHDQTNRAFFIIQGEIRVLYHSMDGKEVILCDLPAGEMFGELTAIDGHSRSATVISMTSCFLASMTAFDFQNLIYSNRQITEIILKRLTGQIRRLTERVYDYSTLPVCNRIQSELLRIARNHLTSPNTAVISPAPTQAELAALITTHREAVSRELNSLIKQKLIMRQGHDLHILDIAKLADIVQTSRGNL